MAKIKCICKQCGKEFEIIPSRIKKGRGKFCSLECYHAWRKSKSIVECRCKNCGKIFQIEKWKLKVEKGMFCSLECYHAWEKGKNIVERRCKNCGKTFKIERWRLKGQKGVFCSRECFRTWVKNKNIVECKCKNCGKTFKVKKWKLKEGKGIFCSRKCHLEYQTKNKIPTIQQKVNISMRTAVTRSIKEKKGGRKWESLLEYTLKELCDHLEKQFTDGMSWDNYGTWHIDHIIPISKFSFQSFHDEGFKKAWGLDNLQPLWAKDNIKKGGRWRWY